MYFYVYIQVYDLPSYFKRNIEHINSTGPKTIKQAYQRENSNFSSVKVQRLLNLRHARAPPDRQISQSPAVAGETLVVVKSLCVTPQGSLLLDTCSHLLFNCRENPPSRVSAPAQRPTHPICILIFFSLQDCE